MPLFNYLPAKLPSQFPSSLPTGFYPMPLSTMKPMQAVKEKLDAVPASNTAINGLGGGSVHLTKKQISSVRTRKTNRVARKNNGSSRKASGIRKAKATKNKVLPVLKKKGRY